MAMTWLEKRHLVKPPFFATNQSCSILSVQAPSEMYIYVLTTKSPKKHGTEEQNKS